MAKREGWKKGEGPYSNSDDFKPRRVEDYQFTSSTKDRFKNVMENGDRNDGYPAGLTPPKE